MNYEPVECKIFEENQNKCFQFWDRVSDRYAEKGIFSERGGYPDKDAETTIKTLLISNFHMYYLYLLHFCYNNRLISSCKLS